MYEAIFYWCVFTCSPLYTQNDICNTRILSNPVEFYFFYQQQKFKLTVPLTQKDLRTPQAKAVQFRCCIGICKNKSFYVLHGYNNLYAPNLYFLEALIFNGEEPNQKELINFRGTFFTERGKCSQVRSQNEFQSLPLLLTKKAPQQRQKSFLVQFFFRSRSFSLCIAGRQDFSFSHRLYKIFMLFFQQKMSLLCFLSLALDLCCPFSR